MQSHAPSDRQHPTRPVELPLAPSVESWPLATRAAARVLAWPRYDTPAELEAIAAAVQALTLPPGGLCLCLRHHREHDGELAGVLPLLERTLAPLRESAVEVLVVDDRIAPEELPRLGRAVSCVLRLPSSSEAPRAEFVSGVAAKTVVDVPGGPAPAPAAPRGHDRRAIVERWLERAQRDCVPYFPPVRLDIALTQACNIRCAYCWQQEKKKGLLTFDVLAGLVDAIAAVWPPSITFTGGEPTVWPDFLRLVAHAADAGVTELKLISNGLRLSDPEFARSVVEAGISSINLSADTLDPEKFERLRGFPFEKFARAVQNCLALRREYPALPLTIGSVISREVTPEDLHALKTFCQQHRIAFFTQTFLDTKKYPDVDRRFGLSPDERRAFHQRLEWLAGTVGDAVKRDANPLTEARTARCYKGVTTVKVHPDGGVAFCWSTSVIGNLLEQGFMDIWTSEAARASREFIRDRRCDCNFDCDVFESLDLPQSAVRRRRR